MKPYAFIYPSLWQDFYVVAGTPTQEQIEKADFIINSNFDKVDLMPDIKSDFLSSNFFPSLSSTYKSIPYKDKLTIPSITKFGVQQFDEKDYPIVKKYLESRGWWIRSKIPISPYEIADIERTIIYGQPKWIKHVEQEAKKTEGKTCTYPDYLF